MKSSKLRRHSGRVTVTVSHPQMKYSYMIEQCLEPKVCYSDWDNYKDGMRDWPYLQWKRADKNKKKWQRFQKRFYRIEKKLVYDRKITKAP